MKNSCSNFNVKRFCILLCLCIAQQAFSQATLTAQQVSLRAINLAYPLVNPATGLESFPKNSSD
jgi:hypothetical protein